jgi:hypothetical protein
MIAYNKHKIISLFPNSIAVPGYYFTSFLLSDLPLSWIGDNMKLNQHFYNFST